MVLMLWSVNVDALACCLSRHLTFDLLNLIRSTVGLVNIPTVLSKLLKLFMRHHGNNISLDEGTDKQMGKWDSLKTIPLPILPGGDKA